MTNEKDLGIERTRPDKGPIPLDAPPPGPPPPPPPPPSPKEPGEG